MERAAKEAAVASVKEKFDKMTSAVFVDFKGLNVEAVSKLREEFRKSGVEYKVVKNTLVRHAVGHQAWGKKLDATLVGMTGIAWSYEDPSAAAKVVRAFKKDNPKLQIKAGLLEGDLMSGKQVEDNLATLPGKNELRASLLATMQAPLQQFLQQLQAGSQNFVYLLAAREEKLKEGGAA